MKHDKPLQPSMLRDVVVYRNVEGIFTKIMDTLTGGPFLAGLALALGASTFQIGLIAAIPFLSKIAFIPAVWVVERFRRRRLICVTSSSIGRPLLLAVALGALTLDAQLSLWLLMGGLAVFSVLATFSGLAWNAWMKDVLPERMRGRLFSSRLLITGVAGMLLSLLGALMVDAWSKQPTGPLFPLATLFGAGAVGGLIGIFFMNRIPEIPTRLLGTFSMRRSLARPFQDQAFRRLIGFSGSWAFATNLAIPFITVYMLSVLHLPFVLVILFSLASQLANLSFLSIWGRLADRFGNKAVLFICAPVFSVSLLLWTFTVNDQQWVTLSLIALIHIMNGIATAGIDVANDNILFQLAPKDQPTPYFATGALFNSLTAGLAPILGGAMGNLFQGQTLSMHLRWNTSEVTVISFAHLDFIFLAAFLVGLFAFNRLGRVKEREQEAPRALVIKSVREEIQNISTIKGMRHLTQAASFFAGLLLESGGLISRPKNIPPR